MASTKVDRTIRVTIDLTHDELIDLWVIFSIYYAHLKHWPTKHAKDLVTKIGEAVGVSVGDLDAVLERMTPK